MHILFIKSVVNTFARSFDFGISSLSAVLKENGHTTDLFIVSDWNNISLLNNRIEETKPDVIAFSTYDSNFQSTVKVSAYIKKYFPKLLQVMGGVHLVLCPEDIKRAPNIDAVCTGEGESVFIDLLKRYKKNDNSYLYTNGFWTRYKNKIIKNPKVPFIDDIEKLPFPDRSIYSKHPLLSSNFANKIRLEFIFTRGCPFSCSYCSNHALRRVFNGHVYVRRLSPKRAIEWIKHDLARYDCDEIIIHDDTFTYDKKWTYEFLDLYKKIKIPFVCNTRIDSVDKKLLTKMKSSGCNMIYMGIESGDDYIRTKIMKRNMTNEKIIKAFDIAKQVNLSTRAFVMMGLPDETPKNFLNTVKLVGKILPEDFMMSIFYPYKGTELYDYSKKKKYLTRHKWDFLERLDTNLNMPQFKRVDIFYYYKNFVSLVRQSRETPNIIKRVYRKYKFTLLSVPPSSPLFLFVQMLSVVDDMILHSYHLFSKRLRESYRSTREDLIEIEEHTYGAVKFPFS